MNSFLRVTFDFNLLPQSVTANHRLLSEGGINTKYITFLCYWRVIWRHLRGNVVSMWEGQWIVDSG